VNLLRSLPFHGVPEKMTRRFAAVVIASQGLAVFFGALVARAIAAADRQSSASTFLTLGSVIAVLCLLDAGLLRRPWGITLGWVLQLATLLSALIVPMMLIVAVLFLALWVTALVQGTNMDALTRRVDAQWYAEHGSPEQEPGGSPTGGSTPHGG
jgi:Protein of unknown function (DUF4233)